MIKRFEKFSLNCPILYLLSVPIFSICNHPCSFMIYCSLFGVLHLCRTLFSGLLLFKGNFGQNNSKHHDGTPLIHHILLITKGFLRGTARLEKDTHCQLRCCWTYNGPTNLTWGKLARSGRAQARCTALAAHSQRYRVVFSRHAAGQ